MFFLFSGEGPTDLGTCVDQVGPLTIVVDQIVCAKHDYSLLESEVFGFVPKAMLGEYAEKELRPGSKFIRLPGGRIKKETRFFHENARALARIAIQHGKDTDGDEVVAILFRDGDKPDERGVWENKRESIIAGFEAENFPRGVPMVPKSVSEAWMLCGLYKQRDPHREYHFLEEEKHGPGSRHQLKDTLKNELGEEPDREMLCDKVRSNEINFSRVDLASYVAFRERFEEVI